MKEKLFVLILLFILFIVDTDCASLCNTAREFRCKNGECISKRERCDFKIDCKDLSDEEDCPKIKCNATSQFRCANGKCISKNWICDSEDDCWDNSDEKPDLCSDHKCSADQYQCRGMRKCIPNRHKCDGEIDCDKRGDDENNCPKRSCRSDEFTCDDGQCIELSYKCDGDEDCKDGSDEKGCTNSICEATQFACLSKTHCIEASFRCDTISDCPDRSDEANCTYEEALCPPQYFACHSNGQCIPLDWKCNGYPECDDKSDELHCDNTIDRCPFGQVFCANKRQCIHKHKKCDGVRDCIDKSDEENCKEKNVDSDCDPETHFRCAGPNGTCIPEHQLCDNLPDCPEKDDEKRGPHFCDYNECEIDNGNCSQTCIDQRVGFRCECERGYKLGEDKRTCEDVNECKEEPCDQFCINTVGSFKCACRHGYIVAHDRSCKPVDADHEVTLVVGDRIRIKKIRLNKALDAKILIYRVNVNSLVVDVSKNEVFWTDPKSETIARSSLSSPKINVISKKPEINSPTSIAVDWIHGLMYWVDIGYGTVSVSKQDGTFQKTLFKTTNKNLISLAIHPRYGYLYLGYAATKASNGSIARCGMDGGKEACDPIIQENIRFPSDMTIDYDQNHLYWVDRVLNELASSDLSGNNRRDHVTDNVHNPFSVAVFSGKVYWSDARQHKLFSIDHTGGELTVVDADIGAAVDIAILHEEKQMPGIDVCNGSPCKFLCLPVEISIGDAARKYSCVCPDHYTTKENDKNDCRLTIPLSTKPPATESATQTTTSDQQTSATSIVISTLHQGMSPGSEVLLVLSIVALILLSVAIVWCVLRWKKRKSARLSMNFNNPIYKKVNASVASSSSINGFVEPSPSTSAGDVSRHDEEDEGTVGLILHEEVPEETTPFDAKLRFKPDEGYASVPNGTREHFPSSSNLR